MREPRLPWQRKLMNILKNAWLNSLGQLVTGPYGKLMRQAGAWIRVDGGAIGVGENLGKIIKGDRMYLMHKPSFQRVEGALARATSDAWRFYWGTNEDRGVSLRRYLPKSVKGLHGRLIARLVDP